jgi:hypothetical protein
VNTERLRALSPDVSVYPVVTSTVTAFAGTPAATAVPLTGLDPAALSQMHGFAATTGADLSAPDMAGLLAVGTRPDARSPVVPAGTRRITLDAEGADSSIAVGVWLATTGGSEFQLKLGGSGSQLTATLNPGPALVVRAVEIAESSDHLTRRQHGVGEGRTDRPLTSGVLRLGTVTADGSPLAWPWTAWASEQARLAQASPGTVAIRYQLSDRRTILTPHAGDLRLVLPVAVDPETAAHAGPNGTFGLSVNQVPVQARVVAVLRYLPAVGSSFVLADLTAVTALLDSSAPGTAAVSQVWISAPGGALTAVRDALEASPAVTATLSYRTELARALAADPVATRSVGLLGVAGGAALLLAMVAAASSVHADREESAASLYALELDGMSLAGLRTVLALRIGLAVLLAVPIGLLAGWALTAAALRLLVTGPAGTAVEPPLRVVLGFASTGGVVSVALASALTAVALASLATLRETLPAAPELDLR